ncbi:stromal membrane-associated protein 1 isoform X1 [Tachysurus ichikawai]
MSNSEKAFQHSSKIKSSSFSILKREDIQIDSRASPKKSPETAIDLLGLDAPAVNTASSGAGSGNVAPISDDLDIFGPMVSNPLPSSTNTNQSNLTSPEMNPRKRSLMELLAVSPFQ